MVKYTKLFFFLAAAAASMATLTNAVECTKAMLDETAQNTEFQEMSKICGGLTLNEANAEATALAACKDEKCMEAVRIAIKTLPTCTVKGSPVAELFTLMFDKACKTIVDHAPQTSGSSSLTIGSGAAAVAISITAVGAAVAAVF